MNGRLVFDHVCGAGKITSGDFIYAPVSLYGVADDDIPALMAEGWAVDEWRTPRQMYQARQVRLRVPNKPKPVMPESVEWVLDLEPCVKVLSDIYEKYRAKKGFSDHLPIEDTLQKHDSERKAAIMFYHYGEAVAFTLLRFHPPALASLQFCWDYEDPFLRLGYLSQEIEFDIASAYGCDYVYIGPGYETTCLYKSRLQGFEWWTGSEWSTDRKLYAKLLERDSRLKTIEDLMEQNDAATA